MLSNIIRNTLNSGRGLGGFSINHSFNLERVALKHFTIPNADLDSYFVGTGKQFTILNVFKRTATGFVQEGLIGNLSGANRSVMVQMASDVVKLQQRVGGANKNLTGTITLTNTDIYYRVAIIVDGVTPANNKIIINKIEDTLSSNALTGVSDSSTGDYAIGNIGVGVVAGIDQEQSQLSIIDRCLTVSEVEDWDNDGFPKNPQTLFDANCVYLFNPDDSGSTAQFSVVDSVNGITATSVNMVDADKLTDTPYILSPISNRFDNNFINSLVYEVDVDFNKRAGGSEWKFTYSGTKLNLRFKGSLGTRYTILVNGVVNTLLEGIEDSTYYLDLPAGVKNIELIQDGINKPSSTLLGTFLTKVFVDNTFVKVNETNVAEKLTFLGDSITQGSGSNNPSIESYAHRFKYDDSKEVTTLGWGSAKVSSFASTPALITEHVGYIIDTFSNVTTTKKLIIHIGTNDFGISSLPSATFKTYYENLLDAINLADSSIEIFCISPLLRTDDAALLDDYRTAISDLCTARPSYTTYTDGKPILTLGDLSDTVHPSTAGHQKFHDYIDSIIL